MYTDLALPIYIYLHRAVVDWKLPKLSLLLTLINIFTAKVHLYSLMIIYNRLSL